MALACGLIAMAPAVHAEGRQPQKQAVSPQQAQAERDKATVVPMAISESHTSQLMASFSNSNTVNSQRTGAQIYAAICQGCHMPQGEGAKGVGFYPPLNTPRISAAAYVGVVVLRGMHAMPSFADRLDDEQVAEVVNYVRSNFGNKFDDRMSAADVKQLRGAVSSN